MCYRVILIYEQKGNYLYQNIEFFSFPKYEGQIFSLPLYKMHYNNITNKMPIKSNNQLCMKQSLQINRVLICILSVILVKRIA